MHRDGDRCLITHEAVERALGSQSEVWDHHAMRPLPAAPVGVPKEQSERELIYRALIELRNEIAEIKAMMRNGHIPQPGTLALPPSSLPPSPILSQPIRSLDELETEALRNALDITHGNRRHAAKALGISERSLYRKLKEKGLIETKYDV
jgi:DNA-binding NtrC family response regulator